MPRKKTIKPAPAQSIELDDDDVGDSELDAGGLDDDLAIVNVIQQLAGSAGTSASVHRVRADGKLAHVCKVTDLAAFDLDDFGRRFGAGEYRIAFYRAGHQGMVAAPQNFSIDDSYGKGLASAPASASTPRDTRESARDDRFLELFITQTAESSRQLQTMMISQQSQMTQILAAMISAKGTPASELAALMTIAKEQAGQPDTLTEVVKTIPAAIQAAAAANPPNPRPSPEQIRRRRLLLRRRRSKPEKTALRLAEPSPNDAPPLSGTPPTPPPAESIQLAGMDPAAIQAAVLGLVRPHLTSARPKPLIAADALIESFGLDNVQALLETFAPYELTDRLELAAPDIDADAIAALESTLRVAVFGDGGDDDGDDDDTPNAGELSDEPEPEDATARAAA